MRAVAYRLSMIAQHKRTIRYVVLLAMAILTASAAPAEASEESLLWNPGPRYRAVITFTKTSSPASNNGCVASGTTLAEAPLVGNPAGAFTSPLLCENETTVSPASNGAAPSYYQVATPGWTSADQDKYPGWAIWNLSGGGGEPIVTQFLNHALHAAEPCTLRELGYSYDNWPYLPQSHFKPSPSNERVRLGQFEKVFGKVTAKETYAAGPPACESLPTGVIEIDFRVSYENSGGSVVQVDDLGVIIDVLSGTVDMNGVEDNIFYQNEDGSTKILYGSRLGLSQLSTSWQSYAIDFKKLIKEYIAPPAGFSLNDAVIDGFDVYSSVRDGDLDFAAKELDVGGVRPAVDSDVNGDGRADLVALHPNGIVYVHPGNAEAKFGSGVTSFSDGKGGGTLDPAQYDGKGNYVIDVADVNGDKRADLVTLTDDGSVHVYVGKTNATFEEKGVTSKLGLTPALLEPGGYEPIAAADVNGDGFADLIAYNEQAIALMVYPGAVDGSFSKGIEARGGLASALHTGSGQYFVDAADVTGDGRADLVSMNSNGDLSTFAGQSNWTFSVPVASHKGAIDPAMDDGEGFEPVGVGDVTGDGMADLVLVKNGTTYTYLGGGDGSFGEATTSFGGAATSTTFGAKGYELFGPLDVNGDGRADIASAASSSHTITAAKGQTSGAFTKLATSSGTFPSTQHFENQNATGNEFVGEKPSWRRRGCEPEGCYSTRYIYYRGSNGQLNQVWFENNQWHHTQHGYANHMGGDPTAVVGPNGTRYTFYRGSNGQLNEFWFNYPNWNYSQLGYENKTVGTPAAVVGKDGTRYVFYGYSNGQLAEYWENGSNWNYTQHGFENHTGGDPTAVIGSDGARYTFYRGSNGQLNEFWFNGPNQNYSQLGYENKTVGTPAAVVGKDGTRYVFYRYSNGQLAEYWENGSNWNYTQHGVENHMAGSPAAVITPDGTRYVYYRDSSGRLDQFSFKGSESNQTAYDEPNSVVGDPSAVATANGTRYVYYRDTGGPLDEDRFSGGSLVSHNAIAGTENIAGDPAAIIAPLDSE